MTGFREEFENHLQDRFGVSERKAAKVAEQAERYRSEQNSDLTPEFLIEEMEKRRRDSLEDTWNSAIGFIFGPGYSTEKGGGKENPYKL